MLQTVLCLSWIARLESSQSYYLEDLETDILSSYIEHVQREQKELNQAAGS